MNFFFRLKESEIGLNRLHLQWYLQSILTFLYIYLRDCCISLLNSSQSMITWYALLLLLRVHVWTWTFHQLTDKLSAHIYKENAKNIYSKKTHKTHTKHTQLMQKSILWDMKWLRSSLISFCLVLFCFQWKWYSLMNDRLFSSHFNSHYQWTLKFALQPKYRHDAILRFEYWSMCTNGWWILWQ